jgi:folate-dependent phosphoribosylglycinamide formyltransferase PurN
MEKLRIIVLFSGSASSLRYLYENDPSYGIAYEIVCGVTNKKDTKGEKFCIEHNIDFIKLNTKTFCLEDGYTGKLRDMPKELRKEYYFNLLNRIKIFSPDLIFLSGFMLEIVEPLLGYRPIINVHPADLRIKGPDGKPKYTGDDAVTLAINTGEKSTVSTIHFVEKEVDCGEIICVSLPLLVEEGNTSSEHQEKMKFLCDGPAYKKELEILCTKFQEIKKQQTLS